jgi:predicted transcriptional regulator
MALFDYWRMAKSAQEDEVAMLLKQLLAIELYRAGLSQAEIRKRLGLGMTAVSDLLKGLSREITVQVKRPD